MSLNQILFSFSFYLLRYPDDNSYEIKNLCTNSIIQKSPVFEKPISPYEETYCVDDAAYEFTMEDSGKDGMCCGYGSGSFAVIYDGTEVASGGEFGRRVTTKPFGKTCVSVTIVLLQFRYPMRHIPPIVFYTRVQKTVCETKKNT